MLRSIASILAGFTVWTVLWLLINQLLLSVASDHFTAEGTTDHVGVLLTVLIASVVFSVTAGWLAAKIARRRAFAHALVLGLVLLAVGIAMQIQYWDAVPVWYHLSFLALLLPATLLGGRLGDQ